MQAKQASSYTCIFARGNAMHHTNHRMHAIIRAAWHRAPLLETFVFYGGKQPEHGIIFSSPTSAARQARAYLKAYLRQRAGKPATAYLKEESCGKLQEDDHFNSTSFCCGEIARTYLWQGHLVSIAADWVSMPRIIWLLRHHCLKAGLHWPTVRKNQLRFIVCGGTFLPYIHESFLNAPVIWFRNSLMHELNGWQQNLKDTREARRAAKHSS